MVSLTVRLVQLVRAVWLLGQGSVALVTVMVVRSGTLGGSALLGFLLAIPGRGCPWCRCW